MKPREPLATCNEPENNRVTRKGFGSSDWGSTRGSFGANLNIGRNSSTVRRKPRRRRESLKWKLYVFELSVNDLNGADTMKPEAFTQPQLYSVRAAAAMLGVGRTTTWKFVSNGTLESVHMGGRRMIRAASLHTLITQGTARCGG